MYMYMYMYMYMHMYMYMYMSAIPTSRKCYPVYCKDFRIWRHQTCGTASLSICILSSSTKPFKIRQPHAGNPKSCMF